MDINPTTKRIVDPEIKQMAFARHAQSHYDGYKTLLEKHYSLYQKFFSKVKEIEEETGQPNVSMKLTELTPDLMTPAMLSIAFALELHIKLLLQLSNPNDKIPREHKIKNLIDRLPADERSAILKELSTRQSETKEQFLARIDMISDFYLKFRYHFEDFQPIQADPFFTAQLVEIIRERIMQKASPTVAVQFRTEKVV